MTTLKSIGPVVPFDDSGAQPLVLFHDACMDGLVAAWMAWRSLKTKAAYVPVRYGAPPPPCAGRSVFILDFCYDPEITLQLARDAHRIVILDHHRTAIDRFSASWEERSDVMPIFDTTRSGAELATWFFGFDIHKEWIPAYAGDRDLWKFELPHSREINALLAAECMGLSPGEAFVRLDVLRRGPMRDIVERGKGAQLQIEAFTRQVRSEARVVTFATHEGVPLINLAKPMTSEVLNALAVSAPFAMGWRQEKDQRIVVSLRSAEDGGVDVQAIAKEFGGGGHVHAAGFTVAPTPRWQAFFFGARADECGMVPI